MGLAVSQVRLLALTRRKADIELDIQVDSKRKQALTRKSTELSQTYYQKLQQAKIQYPTSDGYENVNYDYIMGKTNGATYSDEFLKQVMFMNGSIAQKTCNSMILTNKHGEVVLNDELASLVFATKAAYGDQMTDVQTAEALKSFINNNSNVDEDKDGNITGYGVIAKLLDDLDVAAFNDSGSPTSTQLIQKILKNGGYMDGGTLYLVEGTTDCYVRSADLAKAAAKADASDFVRLQDGYNYNILDHTGKIADKNTYSCMYSKGYGFVKNTAKAQMQYLSNVVSYFAPIISSALKNGMTSKVNITGVDRPKSLDPAATWNSKAVDYEGDLSLEEFATQHLNPSSTTYSGYVIITDKDGSQSVWQRINGGSVSRVTNINALQTDVKLHDVYMAARNTDMLQNGFQSGMFQLCMVDNMAKGRYHKNTTLDFFIQMSYVTEKMDASEREEITAWYNAEQNKISEQETYWDTEITNLSTELNSVNTEIDSVKTLKSNAIKSVFDWGNS